MAPVSGAQEGGAGPGWGQQAWEGCMPAVGAQAAGSGTGAEQGRARVLVVHSGGRGY